MGFREGMPPMGMRELKPDGHLAGDVFFCNVALWGEGFVCLFVLCTSRRGRGVGQICKSQNYDIDGNV